MAKLRIPYLILITGIAVAFGIAVNWQGIMTGVFSVPVAIGYGLVLAVFSIAAAVLPAVFLGRAGRRLKLLNVFATIILAMLLGFIVIGILID